MATYSYRLARGQTRWMFIIDLPPAADGRRRQINRKGFKSQEAALAAETEARAAYSRADLAADGSLAAELENWLRERELDLQPTTLSSYRDIIGYIKPHLGSRHAYTLDKRAIHDWRRRRRAAAQHEEPGWTRQPAHHRRGIHARPGPERPQGRRTDGAGHLRSHPAPN